MGMGMLLSGLSSAGNSIAQSAQDYQHLQDAQANAKMMADLEVDKQQRIAENAKELAESNTKDYGEILKKYFGSDAITPAAFPTASKLPDGTVLSSAGDVLPAGSADATTHSMDFHEANQAALQDALASGNLPVYKAGLEATRMPPIAVPANGTLIGQDASGVTGVLFHDNSGVERAQMRGDFNAALAQTKADSMMALLMQKQANGSGGASDTINGIGLSAKGLEARGFSKEEVNGFIRGIAAANANPNKAQATPLDLARDMMHIDAQNQTGTKPDPANPGKRIDKTAQDYYIAATTLHNAFNAAPAVKPNPGVGVVHTPAAGEQLVWGTKADGNPGSGYRSDPNFKPAF